MVRVLEAAGCRVFASDIADGHDFLDDTRRARSIVTNPPYRLVEEFVLHGLQQTDRYLCLLLGWHFIPGGTGRAERVWRAHPPDRVIAIPQRMVVDGKPSQFNHAWVVWDVTTPATKPTLEWVDAK